MFICICTVCKIWCLDPTIIITNYTGLLYHTTEHISCKREKRCSQLFQFTYPLEVIYCFLPNLIFQCFGTVSKWAHLPQGMKTDPVCSLYDPFGFKPLSSSVEIMKDIVSENKGQKQQTSRNQFCIVTLTAEISQISPLWNMSEPQ